MELYSISASNFGPYEKFELPLYKQGLIWVGGINNDTDAADSNGSGKSSIFKAITWGLYGETIDGEKGDKVIRDGEKIAEVKLGIIDSNSEIWTISRTRTKNAPRLTLLKPDGKIYEGNKNDIQDRIIHMVGLDFKAFKNTVLYGQNDSSRFANPRTKDSERKTMLHSILNTELLEACYKKAGEIAKTVKSEIRVTEEKLERAKAACGEHDTEYLQLCYSNYEIEKEERILKHKNKALEYRNEAKQVRKESEKKPKIPNTKSIEDSISLISIEISEAEKANDIVNSLDGEIDKETEVNTEYVVRVSSLKKELKISEEALERLGGDRCPVCTTVLNSGEAYSHIIKLKQKHACVVKELKKIDGARKKQEEKLCSLKNKRKVYEEKSSILSTLYKKLNRLESELSEAKIEISRIKERSVKLVEKAKSYVAKAKDEIAKIQEIVIEENPYLEQLARAKAKVEMYANNIAEYNKTIEEKSRILAYYEFWVKGFSNQGLPSYVLDSVMPYITERANNYLDTLSDGDITISFSTQRELKSSKGEMRDEIEIRWSIEGSEMYPPSGGQLKKMEIATDLALMDLVASNEGGNLDLLMLDEVFDGLDSEGNSRVLALLQKLRARRSSIFVVSHESKMSEVFEKGIYAVKRNGTAYLEGV